MAAIASATRRFRTTKGCYLTHGADSYDKKGLNKARRAVDRAVIAEQQDETEFDRQIAEGDAFRLVVTTQVYENYGYRMKPKGGNEYHVALGSAMDVLKLGSAGIKALMEQVRSKVERTATEELHSSDEWVIDWAVVPSNERTDDEQMIHEFLLEGWYTEEQAALARERLILRD